MSVPYEIKPRRDGDICSMYSNGERARLELGWIPSHNLEQMCEYSLSKEILFFPPYLIGERFRRCSLFVRDFLFSSLSFHLIDY